MIYAVNYILENSATIQAMVRFRSNDTDYKVYPVVVPQSESDPYIVTRIAGKSRPAKNCDFNYTIEVLSYATSYDGVTDLNDAVISVLEAQAAGTINGVTYGYLVFTNELDGFDDGRDLYFKISTFEGSAS